MSRPAVTVREALTAGMSGMTLIEASAGTGKTRILTGVVAGLVVEERRRLDEILVVTFTRAATAELRDRIRGTLRAAHRGVAAGEAPNGTQAEELLSGWREAPDFEPEVAARRLEAALEEIDRANVFTIHGFCQRVLADLAFDGGFPFGFEVSGDDTEVVARAARDFWRRRMYSASRVLAGYAVENGFQPDELADWVGRWRGKPDLRLRGGEPLDVPIETREAAWREVLEDVRGEWEEHREAFLDEVRNGSWLNRSKYRAPRTESELAVIAALLAASDSLLPPAGLFARYGAQGLADACKKGHELPENPLFAEFDRLEEASARLRAACDAWLRHARREVLAEAGESVRRRVLEDRCLGYDDLLLELYRALRSESGERLARRIRRNFPVALIDEFQDTDPVQAVVFMRIYRTRGGTTGGAIGDAPGGHPDEGSETGTPGDANGVAAGNGGPADPSTAEARGAALGSGTDPGPDGAGGFFVVGDSKQSIYRFRGADVFAFLRARKAAHSTRELSRNWRSVPALVEAVNAIFAGSTPFVVPEIRYSPVAPGREEGDSLRIDGVAAGAPFGFRLLPARPDGKRWPKGEAGPFAAGAAAEEIARLLAHAENGRASVEGRPLTGADVAVLVRTRAQGRLVADALRERNVRCVEVGDTSVFESREAEQMERLLWALAEPGRETRERGALAGDLFGLDAVGLLALEEDENAWSRWAERLRTWRADWGTGGIGTLLRRLVEAEGGAARLLRYRDGARRLTNVRHLTDLLQAAEAEQRTAPAGLALWFSRRREEAETRDEDLQLRLESDEELVRVLTVHGAKGLEFPVVFLPFAWDVRNPSRAREEHAAYHAGEPEGYREVLDLEPDEAAKMLARREELSEDLRLLYVALTRAKYRCTVTWGRVNFAEHAPLAWLLHRARDGAPEGDSPSAAREDETDDAGTAASGAVNALDAAVEATAARLPELADEGLHEEVRAFAASRPESVSAAVLAPDEPARSTVLAISPPASLAARTLDRSLRRKRQLTSFSALTAAAVPSGTPVAQPDVDRPDHDQHEAAESADESGSPVAGEAARAALSFPRGPVAGRCLHRIFERLDEVPGAAPDLDGICGDALAEFGFPGDFRPVARSMVERTRAACLVEPGRPAARLRAGAEEEQHGFRLADPLPRLVELEFAFPVAGLERARLGASLEANGYRDPFFLSREGRPEEPPRPPVDGFLRGFVDLVIEHGERWYVIDYKSNWLGPSPGDYSREAVAAAMRASAYPLQYLLYLVALHRYLGLRLPGYDFERHVGGVFYLFVRGMDPAFGMERGVWFDRPQAGFVDELDGLFRGAGE